MNSPTPYLLILESDLRLSETVREHLQRTLPEVTPLLARTVAEANVLIYQYEFSAFLISLALSDGDGLEFIVDLKTVMPDAQIIVTSAIPLTELEVSNQYLGQYHFLQKPIDILELDRMLTLFFPDAAKNHSFHGSLRQMRLVDLIQVKCLSGDSCQLMITGPSGNSGVITVSAGEILHAQTDTLKGIEAFNEILGWKRGFFHEAEFVGGVNVNITGRWEMVLMEAVRRSDECCALEMVLR
jgi:DNA-binding NtrC family response regulator